MPKRKASSAAGQEEQPQPQPSPQQPGDNGEGFMPLDSELQVHGVAIQAPPASTGAAKARKNAARTAAVLSTQQQQQQPGEGEGDDGASTSSRVLYLGNLPHGFYEKEMLGYFSQFGKLTHVRMSRNKKTGKGKHYAFLQFQHAEVARIVAAAMDGYFLATKRLTCRQMRPEQIHPQLFKGANQKFKNVPWRKLERKRHDKELTPAEHARRIARRIKKDAQRQAKIKEAGIDYEYTGLKAQLPTQPKKLRLG